MSKWSPQSIMAFVVIVACFVLIIMGIDGDVKGILGMAIGWLFKAGQETIKQKIEAKKNGN